MNLYNVIRRPLVTEKSFTAQGEENVYVFEVDRRAGKNEIRRAVEQLFDVQVVSVRTLIVRGKVKRFGRTLGKRPNWKKAYVQVVPGQTIPVFEGA
ncbi:MAG: 50S ribosomal protein L23 [Candidatus Dadabacteria bacterium]|nr:MAG: 50S ribosomal protein L23 [Candidatus Dadabacteria bacterium]